jgi:hypothetical protein
MVDLVIPISDLPAATVPLVGTEQIPIVQGGVTKKVGASALQTTISYPTTVANGGTGLTSYAQGDILFASAPTTLSALAKNTDATRYLSNTGSSNNPAWAQVNLANGVSGTLPIGNGGTGQTTAQAAITALLPDQATHGGQFLQTDGAGTLSWEDGGSGGAGPQVATLKCNGDGTIIESNGIDSITIGPSSGQYNIVFEPGFFAFAPTCQATILAAGTGKFINVGTSTTAGVTVRTLDNFGSGSDQDFSFIAVEPAAPTPASLPYAIAFGKINCNTGAGVASVLANSVGIASVLRQFSGQYLVTFTPGFFNSTVATMVSVTALVVNGNAKYVSMVGSPAYDEFNFYTLDAAGNLAETTNQIVTIIAIGVAP